jgi:esterase/lipase
VPSFVEQALALAPISAWPQTSEQTSAQTQLLGRHDTNVTAEVAAEWFVKVEAPEKHIVWFEHSAHLPMTEEPGKFLISLVSYARPIAERAGDVAP